MRFKHFLSIRVNRGIIVRVIADIFIINFSVLAALVIKFLLLIILGKLQTVNAYSDVLRSFLSAYFNSTWLLTPICLIIFHLSGCYTHGRFYRRRYKALTIFQAVSISYLLFGFLCYFIRGSLILPRSVWTLAWILNTALSIGARLWATVWDSVRCFERFTADRRERENDIHNVLVIGGAGYIGSVLLPKLLKRGYNVRVLDLLIYGDESIRDLLNHPRFELIKADFRHVDKVVEAMRNIDAVIHLGAIVGDPACALNEKLTIEINLVSTRTIAEIAKGSGVTRFIFASTCSVYGACDEILTERSRLKPLSLYARTKAASEQVLMSMADNKFAPVILRFGTVYGLSRRTRFDLVINLLTAKAVVDGEITIFGGNQWRPFIHVEDAALAILKILEAPLSLIRNQIFNTGSNEQNYTIQQVGEIIHSLVPTAKLINMGSDNDQRNYRVDFSKLRNTIGFMPQWTVEQGVQQIIEAIKSGKIKDYRDPKYSNVKFLREENALHFLSREDDWVYKLIEKPYLSRSREFEGARDSQSGEMVE